MNQVMIDIWPYLIVPILGAVGWLFREIYLMKANMRVLEKTYDNMQKRLDAHSQKQDDLLEKLSQMEKEVLKQMGTVRADISAMTSDLKGLSNLILVSDKGLKIDRQ